MLFPLYLLITTTITFFASQMRDFAPFRVLTHRTLGISIGLEDGSFRIQLHHQSSVNEDLLPIEQLVQLLFLWELIVCRY